MSVVGSIDASEKSRSQNGDDVGEARQNSSERNSRRISSSSSTKSDIQTAPEEVTEEKPPTHDIPNGGLQAWLQVVGAFFFFFNTWGIVNSFGVFQAFYESDLLKTSTESNISWIGSIQAFLLQLVGAVTGPIYDAGYFRELSIVGSFLVVFSLMMTSLGTEYWHIMLSQALCLGIGAGCLFIPCIALLPQYFTTKRAFATGIAASGSSLGGVIYPIVFYRLQPVIGFPWATRVLGFMALATLSVSLAVMRVRLPPTSKRRLVDWTAFKEPAFNFATAGFFFGYMGIYIPIFYIQTYGQSEHIVGGKLAFYMLSVLNASSIFGRIVPNFLADTMGPLNMMIPCSLIAGILAYCWIAVKSLPSLAVFSILYGFFSGSLVSLSASTLISLTPHLGIVGTRMGMCFSLAALGLLIGTPAAGAILRESGWVRMQVFSATTTVAGAAFFAVARYCHVGAKIFVKG
ncbi:MAG: hypothetical protein M1819_002050 [Sarea resinae]|nr:MAG: hypothetical protein M1819_002050 [Sarea resinae]